jgi:hypothetical protein
MIMMPFNPSLNGKNLLSCSHDPQLLLRGSWLWGSQRHPLTSAWATATHLSLSRRCCFGFAVGTIRLDALVNHLILWTSTHLLSLGLSALLSLVSCRLSRSPPFWFPMCAQMENYISVGIEVVFADMLNTLRPGPWCCCRAAATSGWVQLAQESKVEADVPIKPLR